MKLKKLVSALVSGAMILGTMAAVPVFAEDDVVAEVTNGTTTTSHTSIDSALSAVQDNDTVILKKTVSFAGKTLPAKKNVTYTSEVGVTIQHRFSNLPEIEGSITFRGLNFDGDAIAQYGSPDLSRLDLVIDSCTFKNAGGNCVYIVPGIKSLTVTGCTFTSPEGGAGTQYLVWPYNAHTINITNNSFTGNGTRGAIHLGNATKNATVSGNTINSFERGVQVALSGGGNVNITGNTFSDIKKYSDSQGRTAPIFIHSATDQDTTTVDVTNNTITNSSAAVFGENDIKCISAFTGNTVDSAGAGDLENNSATYAAKIGDKGYATLADAVAAALGGGTVTLLRDATGNGVKIPGGSNVTIDFNGFTYNVDGTTVGSSGTETNGFQLLQGSDITFKNGKITSNKAQILIQNYSNLTLENMTLDGSQLRGWYPYTLSNNCGNTVITGNTNITAKTSGYAFDSCKFANYPIPTVTVETTGTINGNIELTGGNLIVKSGTFTSDVAKYVAEGYYQKDNGNGTYTVLPVEAKVIDTAKTTGATVTLDNLNKNAVVNPAADATYKVVVETAPAADAKKANDAIKANDDTNTSKAMFDISVVKTDSNGVETVLKNVTQQQVTLTLGETPVAGSTVYVYHVVGTAEQIKTPVAEVTADGTNKVTFTAPSFSTYAVTYTATPIAEANIAKNVGVAFERVGDTSEYNIVLKALDTNKTINRFMSADLTFDMNVTSGAVGYTVNPAASVNLIDKGDGRYEFNLDGLTSSGATGTEVTIGTVTFEGNGTVKFGVKTEGVTTNIVNTAKAENNIVDNYTTAGNGTTTGKLKLNDDVTNGVINETFTAPTKDLTVNIAYNNKINNKAAAYQDMTVTISGGDLSGTKTVELGTTPVKSGFKDPNNNVTVTYDADKSAYTVKVANELTQNVAYTVTVEGAGYRTARYTVNMATDKTLNFWNNVLDANNKQVIEVGAREEDKVTKNFLAGDIVKDNNINIYDLSAVVSYFGETGLINVNGDANAYAKYDLNRDGKIDSKDVAYVLVSWGK